MAGVAKMPHSSPAMAALGGGAAEALRSFFAGICGQLIIIKIDTKWGLGLRAFGIRSYMRQILIQFFSSALRMNTLVVLGMYE